VTALESDELELETATIRGRSSLSTARRPSRDASSVYESVSGVSHGGHGGGGGVLGSQAASSVYESMDESGYSSSMDVVRDVGVGVALGAVAGRVGGNGSQGMQEQYYDEVEEEGGRELATVDSVYVSAVQSSWVETEDEVVVTRHVSKSGMGTGMGMQQQQHHGLGSDMASPITPVRFTSQETVLRVGEKDEYLTGVSDETAELYLRYRKSMQLDPPETPLSSLPPTNSTISSGSSFIPDVTSSAAASGTGSLPNIMYSSHTSSLSSSHGLLSPSSEKNSNDKRASTGSGVDSEVEYSKLNYLEYVRKNRGYKGGFR
jgi:hypothetical protein